MNNKGDFVAKELLKNDGYENKVVDLLSFIVDRLYKLNLDYVYLETDKNDLLRDIIESIDCAGAKASIDEEIKLTVLNREQALGALKKLWIELHPQHTQEEYMAAMTEFEKFIGL